MTDERLVHLLNESFAILFILLGIMIFFKLVQLFAMEAGTAVNDDGIYIADNPVS